MLVCSPKPRKVDGEQVGMGAAREGMAFLLCFLFILFEGGRIKNSNKLSKQHLQLLGKEQP